ncbi:MAG: type II secretion system ATPase GspE [Deltaproteobacteria bacterium]|nr:type II secretion system ATPase GspE [Deltaproteobacteria bacterium]
MNKSDIDIAAISARFGLPYKETIEDSDVDPAFLEKLPLPFVKANMIFPLKMEEKRLLVALSAPKDMFALDDVERMLSVHVWPVLSPPQQILNAIHRFYERISGSAQDVVEELSGESLEAIAQQWEEPKDLLDLTDEAPVIKLLNSLLFQAVKEKASDVHIEPFERRVDVRFRIDGVLYPVIAPPKIIQDALISRVKIMANMDIAEKRLPQDGRIRLLVAGKDIDVRVATVPTAFGERAVLRLLDRKGGLIGLEDIGLQAKQVKVLESLLLQNHGIILVTGPTGSGKTTTLYAALNRINSNERNIITIEDPIEYQLNGIGQIQVNPKINLNFANGLRSILRQDPDIIMVGEIRDMETAKMAIQASLTGHLVLSTLHTNDAPTAVTRLVDMGIEPFLLSSSLSAVIAQRLMRVLCPDCKEEYAPTEQEIAMLQRYNLKKLWRARGCGRCFKTGYQGRIGIFEFMQIDQSLRTLLLKNPDSTTVKEYAVAGGMKTIREDGLEKAATGVTSLEEVLRVTQID